MDYQREVRQLFDDGGEECPVGAEFVRMVSAFKAGAECRDFAAFKQNAARLGLFSELFRTPEEKQK